MSILPEIQQIEKRIQDLGSLARSEVLAYSSDQELKFPLYKVSFGSEDPQAPVLGLIGGVHGLERIGSQVCISLLNSFSELVKWDRSLQETLKHCRVFFIPTVNPVGIYRKTRCNPQGVDLMRNAPIEADNPQFMLSGHRYGPRWPWYRGPEGADMQIESQALVASVQREIKESKVAVTVDFHSGFGLRDRLWFPYAKTTKPYPDVGIMYAWKELFEKTYPHHFYQVEPQAKNYTTHGDLWDYIYDRHRERKEAGLYLPLCLEMGSWLWVKKNPWQIFSSEGPFNPVKGHRLTRTLRRHNTLFEFLLRSVATPELWANLNEEKMKSMNRKAQELWYGGN